jgi:predicted RNA-binding Zn ribbon-like protein
MPPGGALHMRLVGGHLALDFVNTVGGPRDAPPDPDDDALESYTDLVRWGERVSLLSGVQARALLKKARSDERAAARVLRDTLELRQLIYDVVRPIATADPSPPKLLERLRDAEREGLAHARLEPAEGGRMRWSWTHERALEAPLWPLAHAAVDLLTSGALDRLKVCANCRWLFLDRSRNGRRRWCSMDECGVVFKKARFVERRRAQRRA